MTSAGGASKLPQLRPSGRTSCGLTAGQLLAYDVERDDPYCGMTTPRQRLLLEGPIDRDILARCLEEMLARHAVLGSSYVEVGGQIQQILPPSRHSFDLDFVSFEDSSEEAQQGRWRELVSEYCRPFDFGGKPVLRSVLVKLGPDRHVLMLVVHHIAWDRGSAIPFASDLKRGYRALSSGEQWPQPELQFIDLAAHLEDVEASAVGQQQRAFWDRQLAGAQPVEIPLAHSRSALEARRNAHPRGIAVGPVADLAGTVPPPLHADILKLARGERATPYFVLLAGFSATLYRFREQNFLTYQTTYSLRGKPAAQNLIGYVGNPILVCIGSGGSPTYRELIARARRAVLDAWSNSDVPVTPGAPHGLCRININYQPGAESIFDKREDFAPGISLTRWRTPIGNMKLPFDLQVRLAGAADHTVVGFAYRTELFDAETVQALLAKFVETLGEMCQNPDKRL